MGCSASHLDSEESVARCKDRKRCIKIAVQNRHAFAASHAAYTQSLRNTGAAIRQFGEGDAKDHQVAQILTNVRNPLALPPPLPHFLTISSPRHSSSLSRAVSMPPLPLRSAGASPVRSPSIHSPGPVKEQEEEETEKEFYMADAKPPPRLPADAQAPPPPPPPSNSAWDLFNVFPPTEAEFQTPNSAEVQYSTPNIKTAAKTNGDSDMRSESRKREDHQHVVVDEDIVSKKVRMQEPPQTPDPPSVQDGDENLESDTPYKEKTAGSGKNLILVLRELDDQFLTAFESGKEVARMLEARKMHYHSSFGVNSGMLDHYSKVLRVMSWGRHQNMHLENEDAMDPFHSDEKETHASTLDKLLAWEKKFHDEVKAGEVIRMELERKSVQLKNQKKREEDSTTINKTRAVVKSLQTRYLVEFQAVDAASSEVQKLRDDYLHKQLVDLVKELMEMWKAMLNCHQQQFQLIDDMETLDRSNAPSETNESHRKNTLQLEAEINAWHENFDKLITTQKEYISALYQWLRLNISQIESDSKNKAGSPQKMVTPPVYRLCREWLDSLDQLPGNVASHALKAFSNIIHELTLQQAEEIKQKKRLESLKRELEKKEMSLKNQEMKYDEKYVVQQAPDEKEEQMQETATDRSRFREKEAMVEGLRRRVEEEEEKYKKLCSKSGIMTLTSLEKGLSPVLSAMRDFARTCFERYTDLCTRTLTLSEEDAPKLQLSY